MSPTTFSAYIKIDTTGAGHWDRLLESCDRFLRQRINVARASVENRSQVQGFAKLVKQDRFQITVVTALTE